MICTVDLRGYFIIKKNQNTFETSVIVPTVPRNIENGIQEFRREVIKDSGRLGGRFIDKSTCWSTPSLNTYIHHSFYANNPNLHNPKYDTISLPSIKISC